MISENLLYDPEYNKLSIEAQLLFIRILIKTDDYGIVPADQWCMFNLSQKIQNNIDKYLDEIEGSGLAISFYYNEKPFFLLKRDRFDDYQSYLIKNRTRSEYLRLDKETMEGSGFQEILGNSRKFPKGVMLTNREIRDKSTKIKDKDMFDFESLWNRYPRKIGKKEAIGRFRASVKTEEDWKNINTALDNFLQTENVVKNNLKYIKHGDNWFNNWRDYIVRENTSINEPESGLSILRKKGMA